MPKEWTKEEIENLKKYYDDPTCSWERLLAMCGGRKMPTIRWKAYNLGLKGVDRRSKRLWSAKEDAYLHEHWQMETIYQMSERLGMDYSTVLRRCQHFKLDVVGAHKAAKKAETDARAAFIAAHCQKYNVHWIAEQLGVSEAYVYKLISSRGIIMRPPEEPEQVKAARSGKEPEQAEKKETKKETKVEPVRRGRKPGTSLTQNLLIYPMRDCRKCASWPCFKGIETFETNFAKVGCRLYHEKRR